MASISLGKYNIFHRPEEAILFVMVKACLHYESFLFLRALKEYFLIYAMKRIRDLHMHAVLPSRLSKEASHIKPYQDMLQT